MAALRTGANREFGFATDAAGLVGPQGGPSWAAAVACAPTDEAVRHRGINLAHVRVAVEVARAGSFSGAGRALYMSQSAVSRQVAALEKHLNVRLFDRRAAYTEPTEHGQAFLAAASDLLVTVDKLVLAARASDSPS
jgi:DNA-binding MarR family transcriptional regulator